MERHVLFHVLSPLVLDPDGHDDPDKFIVLDNVWLSAVDDLRTRTNEGIQEAAVARLSALPPRSKDARITVKEGVEIRYGKQGMEFVRLSDGLGIGLNKKDEYVHLSDRRKRATDKEVDGYMDRVSPEELAIRQNAINVRQARDAIGHVIEALRRNPAIRFEAKIGDKSENVDISESVTSNKRALTQDKKRGKKKGLGKDTLVVHIRDVERVPRYKDVLAILDSPGVAQEFRIPPEWNEDNLRDAYSRGQDPHREACSWCAGNPLPDSVRIAIDEWRSR